MVAVVMNVSKPSSTTAFSRDMLVVVAMYGARYRCAMHDARQLVLLMALSESGLAQFREWKSPRVRDTIRNLVEPAQAGSAPQAEIRSGADVVWFTPGGASASASGVKRVECRQQTTGSVWKVLSTKWSRRKGVGGRRSSIPPVDVALRVLQRKRCRTRAAASRWASGNFQSSTRHRAHACRQHGPGEGSNREGGK